jgi:putative transposase
MGNDTLKLSDREVLEHARSSLQDHLPLHAAGYQCRTEDLLNLLLGVAVGHSTLQELCADLPGTPDAETIRTYLNEQLTQKELPKLEEQLNAALADQIPQRVRRQGRKVAIDFHDRPYYGKSSQEEGLWVRGRASAGTTRFYRIATAYVMHDGLRVTLALRFVVPEQTKLEVLQELLQRLKTLKIPLKRLFLDKGFATIAIMEYLTDQGYSAVIACPIRGTHGGTRGLCQGRCSYRTTHTFKGEKKAQFTAELAVCRVFTSAKRTKRLKRRGKWMVFILIHLELAPRQVRRVYRRRFGIESSYRCATEVRGWTTSPNPAYRFLLLALGFFVATVWVNLRWLYTQVPRRGGRKLDVRRFRLSRLAHFIRRALERRYGCVHEIIAPAPPRL